MAKYKYQIGTFNLFDYAGVERHLEKMAAKGWQFDSIGSFGWKYKKAEPTQVKYSVTYIPEASDFDPEPLEKQKEIEAYCEEAGWKKVGSWLQMLIFCSDNPEAVPIETDEELRLGFIEKSMKKNLLVSHGLLLLVFVLNMFTTFSTAKRNWVEFLSDSHRLWNTSVWMWGILILLIDLAFYFGWMHKAKKAVKEGLGCPAPKGYRYWNRMAWCGLAVLVVGMFASYTSGMIWFMLLYLAGIILIIFGVRKLQLHLKKEGVSKGGNMVVTMFLCMFLTILFLGVFVAVIIGFDISLTGKKEPDGTILLNGKEWKIYQDTLPLYVEDFAETGYSGSSREAREQSSFLAGYGDYEEFLFEGKEVTSVKVANTYEVITVKAKFLYNFLLEAFYEREFRHSDEEEKQKTEYRAVYEAESGTIYRQYYEGLPVVHDWLILTENKIVPMHLYLDDLTEEQMKKIVDKFAE